MPIREESFRIGSGRYLQGCGYIEKVGDEVNRLGKAALVVGGKTALEKTQERLKKSLDRKCNIYEIIVYEGTCNDEKAKEFANIAILKGYDVIVGVGGGVICDFAKLCSYYANLPIINIPTSSATCAAYTPLSVRYTKEGKTTTTLHYEYEIDCVIVDTEIIIAQPIRLLLAGIFDSIAKFIEIKHRFSEDSREYPLGLDYAYVMSKYSYNLLTSKTKKSIEDMKKREITEDVENVIFSSIAVPGIISGVARGSNQTALGHKFYETTRLLFPDNSKPYLHGEIVGVGLLLQNHFNGEEENNKFLLEFMKKYNMPSNIGDLGIEKNDEVFEAFYEKICNSSSIDRTNVEECERFRQSLKYLWNI